MMSCSMIKAPRLGAQPWLKDEQHYTYKKRSVYKKSKHMLKFLWVFPFILNRYRYHLKINCFFLFLKTTLCTTSAQRRARLAAKLRQILSNYFFFFSFIFMICCHRFWKLNFSLSLDLSLV